MARPAVLPRTNSSRKRPAPAPAAKSPSSSTSEKDSATKRLAEAKHQLDNEFQTLTRLFRSVQRRKHAFDVAFENKDNESPIPKEETICFLEVLDAFSEHHDSDFSMKRNELVLAFNEIKDKRRQPKKKRAKTDDSTHRQCHEDAVGLKKRENSQEAMKESNVGQQAAVAASSSTVAQPATVAAPSSSKVTQRTAVAVNFSTVFQQTSIVGQPAAVAASSSVAQPATVAAPSSSTKITQRTAVAVSFSKVSQQTSIVGQPAAVAESSSTVARPATLAAPSASSSKITQQQTAVAVSCSKVVQQQAATTESSSNAGQQAAETGSSLLRPQRQSKMKKTETWRRQGVVDLTTTPSEDYQEERRGARVGQQTAVTGSSSLRRQRRTEKETKKRRRQEVVDLTATENREEEEEERNVGQQQAAAIESSSSSYTGQEAAATAPLSSATLVDLTTKWENEEDGERTSVVVSPPVATLVHPVSPHSNDSHEQNSTHERPTEQPSADAIAVSRTSPAGDLFLAAMSNVAMVDDPLNDSFSLLGDIDQGAVPAAPDQEKKNQQVFESAATLHSMLKRQRLLNKSNSDSMLLPDTETRSSSMASRKVSGARIKSGIFNPPSYVSLLSDTKKRASSVPFSNVSGTCANNSDSVLLGMHNRASYMGAKQSSREEGLQMHHKKYPIVDLGLLGARFSKSCHNKIALPHSYGRPRAALNKLLYHKFGIVAKFSQGAFCTFQGTFSQMVLTSEWNKFAASPERKQELYVGTGPVRETQAMLLTQTNKAIPLFLDPNQKDHCIYYVGHWKPVRESLIRFSKPLTFMGTERQMYIQLEFDWYDINLASVIRNGETVPS